MTENALIPALLVEDLPEAFAKGASDKINTIIDDITTMAKTAVEGLSVDDEEARKKIASTAYDVARSKTTLDDAGKKFIEGPQAEINRVNKTRKEARDALDALKIDIRKPLTEYEAAEKKRREEIEAKLRLFDLRRFSVASSLPEIRAEIDKVQGMDLEAEFGEAMAGEATLLRDRAVDEWRALADLMEAARREPPPAPAPAPPAPEPAPSPAGVGRYPPGVPASDDTPTRQTCATAIKRALSRLPPKLDAVTEAIMNGDIPYVRFDPHYR